MPLYEAQSPPRVGFRAELWQWERPTRDRTRLGALVLAAVLAFALIPGLRRGGLSGYDDALYAYEARQMVETGNWLTPLYNGHLNFEYPPLFLWLDALSFRLFGVSDFAAKLPAAAAGIGTILLLYGIGVELTRKRWVGLAAATVLALTPPFLKYASHAMTDVPFTFFTTLALWLYLKSRRHPLFALGCGAAVAAAILTRSILGAGIALTIAIDAFNTRSRWTRREAGYLAAAGAIAAAIPLAWAWSQYALFGPAFIQQHLGFLSEKTGGANMRIRLAPYVRELVFYYGPWLPVCCAGIYFQLKQRFHLPLIWLGTACLPLLFAETPYGRYVMPAFPPLALCAATALDRWIPTERRRLFFGAACFLLFAIGAWRELFPARERGIDMRTLAPIAEPGDGRVLLYTGGTIAHDYRNQLLWYGRYRVEHLTDLDQLAAHQAPGTVGIVDHAGFVALRARHPRFRRIGESERFVCYRVEPVSSASLPGRP